MGSSAPPRRRSISRHVSLTALVGFASISLSDLIGASSFGYAAGPAVSLPLFDGGRLRAQYHGAAAQLDQAVVGYNDTVLQAVRQAADQLSQIDALSRELEQQRQWSDAAEDAYRLAEERYRAGLAGYLTVLNAETEVLNARRQSVDLGVALALSRVTSTLLAVGGSFQSPDASTPQAIRFPCLAPSVSSSCHRSRPLTPERQPSRSTGTAMDQPPSSTNNAGRKRSFLILECLVLAGSGRRLVPLLVSGAAQS